MDAAFVPALLFYHGDLEPDCVRVSTREGSAGRAYNAKRRDASDASSRLVSFRRASRGEEAGRFREVAVVSIDAAGGLRSWSTI